MAMVGQPKVLNSFMGNMTNGNGHGQRDEEAATVRKDQGQGQGHRGGEGDSFTTVVTTTATAPVGATDPVEFTFSPNTTCADGGGADADISALADFPGERDKRNWSKCQVKLVFFALAWNAFNLLRFPDSIYKNGGGALMLAYSAIMVFVMQPLVYFELLLGQLYLRKNSHRGIREQQIFSFVAKGIGAGTFLTGLFFLPNQLVSMNYAGLYVSEGLFTPPESSSCSCNGLLLDNNHLNLNESCLHLDDVFQTPGLHFQPVEGAVVSCELFYRQYLLNNAYGVQESFLESLNWKLLIPAGIGAFLALILSPKKLPNHLTLVLVSISPLVFFATLILVGSQLGRYGFQDGVSVLLAIDFSTLIDLDFKIWAAASKLAFITSGVGFGILPVIASSNPRRFPHLYRTSWMYIGTICVACLASTFIAFSEIGVLSVILGQTDLRKIITEATNLPLITFCSISCKTEQLVRCFTHSFLVLIFIASCWPKSVICQGVVSAEAMVGRKKRILLIPLIMFLIEAIYILPESRFLLADESFFGGAWTSCAITLIRILAFLSVCTVDKLKIHVRECIRQNIPAFFVFQLKLFMIPLVAMFGLLCLDILDALPLSSSVEDYPEWLKVYGTVLNSLPIIVLFICCINEIYAATYKGPEPSSHSSSLSDFPLNHQPVDPHVRAAAAGKLTITKKSSFRDAISTRPRPMLTSFRSFGDEPPLTPPPSLPTETGRSMYEVGDHVNEMGQSARELLKERISWPMLHYAESLMIAANVGGSGKPCQCPNPCQSQCIANCNECTDNKPRSRILTTTTRSRSRTSDTSAKVKQARQKVTVTDLIAKINDNANTSPANHEYEEVKMEDEVDVTAAGGQGQEKKQSPPILPTKIPRRRRSRSALVLPSAYEKVLEDLDQELEKEGGASGDAGQCQAGPSSAMQEPMDENYAPPRGDLGDCSRYY